MASFLDRTTPQFSPYISQLPDNYVELLALKQGQYNEGVQKVESYIQSLSGLDVVRDVDKQYLNNKIQSLTSEINKTAGSTEWSNKNITNQVGALAAGIYNDPNVQNAVAGTLQYKKLLSDIGEAKKSGKGYSVQNEWDALSSVQSWLGNQQVGAAYSGKSYSPYVDVNEKVRTYFKDKKPNWIVESDPMSPYKDANGNIVAYTMVNNKKEYIDPAQVERELAAILQPEDYNQLGINGRYSGRIYTDPIMFTKELDRQQNFTNKALQNQIDAWKSEIQKNQGNTGRQTQLNGYISNYQKMMEDNNRTYNGYKEAVSAGRMDGVKEAMYTQDYIKGWGSTLGYTKNEITYDESPIYKSILAAQKEDREWEKHKLDLLKTQSEIDYNKARTDATRNPPDKKEKGPKGGDVQRFTAAGLDSSVVDNLVSNFIPETENIERGLQEGKYVAMYNMAAEKYGWDSPKLSDLFDVTSVNRRDIIRPKKGKENEVELEYIKFKDAFSENPNNVSTQMRQYFENSDLLEKQVAARKKTLNKVVKEADKIYNLEPILAGRPRNINLRFPDRTISYSAEEILDIGNKIQEAIVPTQGTIGTLSLNPEQVRNSFSNQKYGFALQAYKKYFNGEPLNRAEQALVDNINDTREALGSQAKQLQKDRVNYINQQLRPFVEVKQAAIETLPNEKADLRASTKNLIQSVFRATVDASGGNASGDLQSNINKADKYLQDDATTYQVQYNPDGSANLIFANSTISSTPYVFKVDAGVAANQRLTLNDPLTPLREILGVNRTPTGWSYTGSTRQEALTLTNPYLSKYGVKYNIEKSPSGQYTNKLFIFDRNSNNWITGEVPISMEGATSLEAALEALKSPELQQVIDEKLKTIDGYR